MSDKLIASVRLDKKAFSVKTSFAAADAEDRAYWHSRTPEERLRQMELLRRINYGRRATGRLQKEFLRLLHAHGVEYLLVGGYAVGYYGYPRATGDIDVWVAPSSDNARRIVTALQEFGFDVPGLSDDLSSANITSSVWAESLFA